MTQKRKIVVIGGSAAGPKTAAKARRLDQNADIVIVQKGPDLSMASCGYPYYVGGVVKDRNELLATPTGVLRDPKFYLKAKGIRALTSTEVIAINRQSKSVTCRNLKDNSEEILLYDKLVISTGSRPNIPPVPGTELAGVSTLQSMQDADYLRKICDQSQTKKAVVIGGGLIGIETCEALQLAGIQITVIELLPQILTFLDFELAQLLENYVRTKADVITANPVSAFLGKDGKLTGVKLKNGTELTCELAVIATGVSPNVGLAKDSGLEIGQCGGIDVDQYLQTSDPDIYAVGDCIEVTQRITGKKTLAPYGDLANLQGRVAAQNLVCGNKVIFPGTIQTGICKVFDYAAGSTGLSETAARKAGFEDIETVITAAPDKPDFMGAKPIIMKMVADRKSGKLLGCQCIGLGDVSKRIAEAAMALIGGLTLADLATADLPYAPPFSPAIDNLIMTAHALENKILGRLKGISATEVKQKIDAGQKPFLLDLRDPNEFEISRLGIGETLIPLGALRTRFADLPQDKDTEIICFCKISLRGYEAQSILEANGWTNVKTMEGGILAWPFTREK